MNVEFVIVNWIMLALLLGLLDMVLYVAETIGREWPR